MKGIFHGGMYLGKVFVVGLILALLFSPFVAFGEGDVFDLLPFYQFLLTIASIVVLFNQIHVLVDSRLEQELPDEGDRAGGYSESPEPVVDTSSPTAVVQTYFDLVDSTSSPTDTLEQLLHSDSVLAVDDFEPGESLSFEGVSLRRLVMRVESEDVGTAVVEAELEGTHARGSPDEEAVEAIAGRNAIVDVDITLAGTTFEPRRVLVAPEDGDWRIVSFR